MQIKHIDFNSISVILYNSYSLPRHTFWFINKKMVRCVQEFLVVWEKPINGRFRQQKNQLKWIYYIFLSRIEIYVCFFVIVYKTKMISSTMLIWKRFRSITLRIFLNKKSTSVESTHGKLTIQFSVCTEIIHLTIVY